MLSRLSSPDLVGRDEALAALTGAIGAATAGPRFVIVRGEAGIGKTRLVREAIAQLPEETLVLLGDCLDIGTGGLPYLPIVEALRPLVAEAALVNGLSDPGAALRWAQRAAARHAG